MPSVEGVSPMVRESDETYGTDAIWAVAEAGSCIDVGGCRGGRPDCTRLAGRATGRPTASGADGRLQSGRRLAGRAVCRATGGWRGGRPEKSGRSERAGAGKGRGG